MNRSPLQGVKNIVNICRQKGIKHAIISPGSRNAPLSILFSQASDIETYTVVDERCAAYIALGIAQQTKNPVALICTSGTASLNYAPALAEAYYQFVPLVAITADRPEAFLDTADGQMIDQREMYRNFIAASFQFPADDGTAQNIQQQNDTICKAIDIAKTESRPVHINVPLSEPLYALSNLEDEPIAITNPQIEIIDIDELQYAAIEELWNASHKTMIIAGGLHPNSALTEVLRKINQQKNVIFWGETHTNIAIENQISAFDIALTPLDETQKLELAPDLLITFGNNLISRKIKEYLRKQPPKNHIHLSEEGYFPDSFGCLTHKIRCTPTLFFQKIATLSHQKASTYQQDWMNVARKGEIKAKAFVVGAPFSDLKAFDIITQKLPNHSQLQMGNSTPVRYIQLFEPNKTVDYYGNRGTSGIDGCVSTAVGAALASTKLVTLIVGDLSFMYDSNAFWIEPFPQNLKIIVINNQGGNIFKFIAGPDQFAELNKAFVAPHKRNFSQIAKQVGIKYRKAHNETSLQKSLTWLFKSNCASILEVTTPSDINGEVLRDFFKGIDG